MKRNFRLALAAMVCLCITGGRLWSAESSRQASLREPRLVLNLNSHWLFKSGDIPNGRANALDESSFQPVCLPHANAIVKHRDIDMRSFWNVSWYRRHFSPSAKYQGRRFFLEFQGASQVTEVFINGISACVHKGAYTPFTVDITDHLRFDADNVIAVRVDSRRHKEIPPEGVGIDYMLFGGISRDVAMVITDPLHIDWVFASCDPGDPARVNLRCRIRNSGFAGDRFSVRSQIIDSAGNVVAAGIAPGMMGRDSSLELACSAGPVGMPRLWDTEHPYLYTVRTQVLRDSTIVDEYSGKMGLRTVSFSKIDGLFSINGKPLRLRGLNRHETFPFIGRAAANRLQAKDADILKYNLGCNCVRCSHYPQAPAFLNRCDEIGLLVLDEIPGWCYIGNAAWQQVALNNVEEMVTRDRNHPSVIGYGVRINESFDSRDLYKEANRLARSLDPTRPTYGARLADRGLPAEFYEDVWAQNFTIPKGKPRILPWFITECVGIGCQVHPWDPERLLIQKMLRFAEVLDSVYANKYLAGALGWCAFDYNSGYVTADHSVCYYGAADIFRINKYAGEFLRSQGDPSVAGSMVYIAHGWKQLLIPNDVWVTGNCEQVELFVNGKSLGRKIPAQYPSLPHPLAVWKNVAFRPGEIKAIGYRNDTIAATCVRKTPGPPVALRLIPDDSALLSGGDMTRVVVEAVDRFGQIISASNDTVALSVSGAADFLGETPIALDGGRTAFFVKTRSDETGAVLCRAACRGLAVTSAHLRVTADPQEAVRQKVLGR